MKDKLRRVWKGMVIGMIVGLTWVVGILLYEFVIHLGWFFEDLFDAIVQSVQFILGYIMLGGVLGFFFGVMFLVIPEKKREPVRIGAKLVNVLTFFASVLVLLFLSPIFLAEYQKVKIINYLFPLSPSEWAFVLYTGFPYHVVWSIFVRSSSCVGPKIPTRPQEN